MIANQCTDFIVIPAFRYAAAVMTMNWDVPEKREP